MSSLQGGGGGGGRRKPPQASSPPSANGFHGGVHCPVQTQPPQFGARRGGWVLAKPKGWHGSPVLGRYFLGRDLPDDVRKLRPGALEHSR